MLLRFVRKGFEASLCCCGLLERGLRQVCAGEH